MKTVIFGLVVDLLRVKAVSNKKVNITDSYIDTTGSIKVLHFLLLMIHISLIFVILSMMEHTMNDTQAIHVKNLIQTHDQLWTIMMPTIKIHRPNH